MADNNNPIKYSDLIKPDNSITDLIKQLEDLGITYSDTLKSVNSEAIKLKVSLQNVFSFSEVLQYRSATKT